MSAVRTVSGALLLLAAVAGHRWLEASMLRHMLLQLPMIAIAGWLLASRWTALRHLRAIDQHGLAVLSALLFASAYWMIPRALELSLTSAVAQAGKFGSLFLLGMLLPGAIERAAAVIQLFFLGNFCAMTAAAGMLYQNLPQRLCNAYLLNDQADTGLALVLVSLLAALAWFIHHGMAGTFSNFAHYPRTQTAKEHGHDDYR